LWLGAHYTLTANRYPLELMSLKAVIFDIDGTLIDSNGAHAESWIDTFEEFGYHAELDQVRSLIGKGGDKLLPEAIGVEMDSDEGKKLSHRRSQIFKQDYLPKLRAFPGVRRLLERMRDDGLILVVATSANSDEVDALLRVAGVKDLMAARTTSSDAEHSKPDPDIVEAAVESAGVEPAGAIMIGDTPYDVEAATRAGVRIVAVRCGGWGDGDLSGAIKVYEDPAAILRDYDGSPFAKSASR
jgi:HAD superfamily hydrolase (TIGR01509 family)